MKSSIAYNIFEDLESETPDTSQAGLPDPDRVSTGVRQCNGRLLRSLVIDDPYTREAAAETWPAWRHHDGVYQIPGASPEMQAAVERTGRIDPRFYDPTAEAVGARRAEEDRQRNAGRAVNWRARMRRLYANDWVLIHVIEYLASHGRLSDAERDDILQNAAEVRLRKPQPFQYPDRWGRAVARRCLLQWLNRRRARAGPLLFEDTASLQLAVRRKALDESGLHGVPVPDALAKVHSWGNVEPVDAFLLRHRLGRTPRQLAVMAILSGHWPESADWQKHKPADVIEGLAKRIRKALARLALRFPSAGDCVIREEESGHAPLAL